MMAFLAINAGKLFTKTVETRPRFSFVHVSLGTADEKVCSSLVQDRPNPILHLLPHKAEYKHSLIYSRNNASHSVQVKVAYSEVVESAVCFMTVVLSRHTWSFRCHHYVQTGPGTHSPPDSVGTRVLLLAVKLLEREADK